MAKYVMIIPDGAADTPLEEFSGKTIIEAADIPNIDQICQDGRQGIVRTVPEGLEPGSDVAQMSILGYDPLRYYSGRAPIEAVAQDIDISPEDWVFRCNLVTIADGEMADHSAGHISTEEAGKLIDELNQMLGTEKIKFYKGVSYRHLLVIKDKDFDLQMFPPHDHIGKPIEKILPRGKNADMLIELMAKSQELFTEHEINKVRLDLGENQVSSIWLWGYGRKAKMESFEKKFGIRGATITAVDLVRGLSKLIGFDIIEVPGATGFIDTNFKGKAEAAIEALRDHDLVFVHVEAPDEAGHSGNPAMKKEALELIDEKVLGPVYEALKEYDDYRILVLPDHPTPVKTKAHSAEPVPFAMAGREIKGLVKAPFSEKNSLNTGFRIDNGFELMEYFLRS